MPTMSQRAPSWTSNCDVVIVGAGIVGALAALQFVRAGCQTAILEALEVASGATGHSTGLVLLGLAGDYVGAIARYGRELARELWCLTQEGQSRLADIAEELEVPLQRTGSLTLAANEEEARSLEESACLLREDSFEAWFEEGDPLNRGFYGVLHSPTDFTIDTAEFAQALLKLAAGSGRLTIHEGTEVQHVESYLNGVRIWAQRRTVFCKMCLLAVDGHAPLLNPRFANIVFAARGLSLVTEPLRTYTLNKPCLSHQGTIYCRQLPDRRLLLGAWQTHVPGKEGTGNVSCYPNPNTLQEKLARFLMQHFPEVYGRNAEHGWGMAGFTPDGLPIVGQLQELPGVYFTLGLGGRGLALAPVVADRAVDLALYGTDPGLLSVLRLE